MNNFYKIQSYKILSCYNISLNDELEKGRKPAVVGEIREYNGRQFQKQTNNKWREITNKKPTIESVIDRKQPTIHEKQALKEYTGYEYGMINSALRRGDVNNRERIRLQVEDITNLLDKLPSFNGAVFRREMSYKDSIEDHINDFIKGEIVDFKAFLSTSEKDNLTKFGNELIFEIKSKNGKQIKNYSDNPDEEEVLFKPNSIFIVENVKQIKYKNGMLKGKLQSLHIKLKEL